ncbi:MAG: TRL-like family protein, partial [Rickettsiales bacterium]|jgi:hypothetical protein|nr:TRL-like family protein [Rickettsiales bacterium]
MRKLLCAAMLLLSACSYTRSPEFVVNEEKGIEVPVNLAQGKSCRPYFLYILSMPGYNDSAIDAAKKGNISKITYIDRETSIYPFFSNKCTRVWGERKSV